MEKPIRLYFIDATSIIKSHLSLLYVPVLIGSGFYIPLISSKAPGAFFYFLSLIVMVVIYPLIYGRYTEIITNETHVSWIHIFNKHWFNYFVVNLILGIPIFIFAIISVSSETQIGVTENLVSASVDVLAIYIIPLVFLTNKKFPSIPLGMKCLLGNFRFSFPLVLVTLFAVMCRLFVEFPSEGSGPSLGLVLFGFIFWVLIVLVDFTVFVTATLILKEKLFQNEL